MEGHGTVFSFLVDLFFISSVKVGSLIDFNFFTVSFIMAATSKIRTFTDQGIAFGIDSLRGLI